MIFRLRSVRSLIKPTSEYLKIETVRRLSIICAINRRSFEDDQKNKLTSSVFNPLCGSLRYKSKWNTFPVPEPASDWLPFTWEHRPKHDVIAESGDTIRTLDVDKTLPMPGFENCEELKTANEYVKKMFSLEQGTRHQLHQAKRQELIKLVQRHPMDFNSIEVRTAALTAYIRNLMDSRERLPMSTRVKVKLIRAIQKRNSFLRVMHQLDRERCEWITKVLQINYKPPPVGALPRKYTRNNELCRLTQAYMNKLKVEKTEAFHAELKSQQEAFLKEKEDILAWIAKEEEAYGIQPSDYEKLKKL